MKVLLFPIKIYPFEIFARATPGSSLVSTYKWDKKKNYHTERKQTYDENLLSSSKVRDFHNNVIKTVDL